MRLRLGGALAIASILTGTVGACQTAGVSAVYMAIDSAGNQRRTTFYTDSSAIYCIAKVSVGRPDATIDFTIRQNGIYPWCSGVARPGVLDTTRSSIQPVFAVGEEYAGVGVENVVSGQLLSSGVSLQTTCNGYCLMDMPPSSFCAEHADGGGSNEGAANAGQCEATYESLGANSCGMGLTCCQSTTTSSSSVSASSSSSSIPYPAGSYTCIVFLDGQNVGESDFDIVYPNGADAPSLGSLGCAGVNASKCYCPVPPPVNGTPCFGWVPEGAECPAYVGDSTCTCMPTGVWSCLE